MDRSEASESTYPESTAGPASPIFGTASFSTFTTTALTSLWPGSSRRNHSSSSSCASDGNSVTEDGRGDATLTLVDNSSEMSSSSRTYNHHSDYSRSTASLTERERNSLSSSNLTSSYHIRSSTDPYTSSSTPTPPSLGSRTHSFTHDTFTPISTPSNSRTTQSYTDSTPTPISTLSQTQLSSGSTSAAAARKTTGELIKMYEQRSSGRSSSPLPVPAPIAQSMHSRTASAPRPESPTKPPSAATGTSVPIGMPGALPFTRSMRGADLRSGGSRSEVSSWSFGSRSNTQSDGQTQSYREPSPRRRGTGTGSRSSSPNKSAVSGWSYSTSSGGGGILGAITGFVGLSGSRSTYSSSGRTSSPSHTYTRRHSRSTSRSGRSPFSSTRRRASRSPKGKGKERARSTSRRSPSRTRRIESETTSEDIDIDTGEHDEQPIYEAPLWYYNVHRLSDYTWQRGYAQLFPHMLVVRWTEASGLIAEVKLDLLSCVEIRTVRPSGVEKDVRVEVERDDGRRESTRLMTFELGYSDSLERLGSETRAEMVAWFEAIQTVFNGNVSLPSSLAPREASPARSTSSSHSSISSPDILDDTDSPIHVGSKSTIYISSSPRQRPASPPPEQLREDTMRRSVTPPVHTTVQTWRDRARAARSEVSSVFDDAASHIHTDTTQTQTQTYTSTLTSGRTILEVGSSTGTDVVASTLSYRNTADASLLGDSCHGSSSYTLSSHSTLRGREQVSRGIVGLRDAVELRSDENVPVHPTGSSRSGQSLSYVTQERNQNQTQHQTHNPIAHQDTGDISTDDASFVTASSPSASFVSLDPVEVLPGEDPDEVFAFGWRETGGLGAVGEMDVVWDGDQILTPTAEEPAVELVPEIEMEHEESIADDTVTMKGPEETEVGSVEPVPVPPPVEVHVEPEATIEVIAPLPATEVEPSVVAEQEVSQGPKPEEIPLPPSVYTPSIVSQALPEAEPVEEAHTDPSEHSDSDDALSQLSLAGPQLSQLPPEMLPPELGTPDVLDGVSTRLASEVGVEEVPVEVSDLPLKSPSLATSWGEETDGTYDSSVLHASPSMRSVARSALHPQVLEGPVSVESERDASFLDTEDITRTPVARTMSISDDASVSTPTEESVGLSSDWSSSTGPPSVPSNSLNTLSEDEMAKGNAAQASVVNGTETAGSVLSPSAFDGEGLSDEGSVEGEKVEPKVYTETAVSPHMEVSAIARSPETSSVSISAEPEVGHKGVGADDSKVDLDELAPQLDNLKSVFKTMLTEETSKLLQYFDAKGNSTGKDLQEMLELLRRTDANLAKHLDKVPEPSIAHKADFATSPIVVARMECSTSPIPRKGGVDRSLSPIDIKLYRDAQIMSSPVLQKKQADIQVTLLSPPRKRAMTPESVVGSYLSSHYSDEASEAPHEGDLSVERVWPDTGSPLSQSSVLSAASTSSRQTVLHISQLPRTPGSRVSTRRRVSSPPATIPGFNIPLNDDVSPLDSISHVGVNAPQPPTIIDMGDQKSILLEPVVRAPSIQMPVPLRAGQPFEGSLAEFMANEVPSSEHARSASFAEKVDQGTSPLVMEQSIISGSPAPSAVSTEKGRTQDELVVEMAEKAISPMIVHSTPEAESLLPDEPVLVEPELEPLTADKGISPIIPVAEPSPEDEDEDDMMTEKAVSPMTIMAPVPETEIVDEVDSTVDKAVSPISSLNIVHVPESSFEEEQSVTADKGVSPIVFPAPVPEVVEETVEVADKNISPATTINALPAKVDVYCETDPQAEPLTDEATMSREVVLDDDSETVENQEQEQAVPEPSVEDELVVRIELPVIPTPRSPELVHEPASPPDSPGPTTPRFSPAPEYLVILDDVRQELRKSREESVDLKEKWTLAQEDAERRRDENLAIQRELCMKVDRMMYMFESLSRQNSPPQVSSKMPPVMDSLPPGFVSSKMPAMDPLPPGFVPQEHSNMQFMYQPQSVPVYTAMSYISPSQIPIPSTSAISPAQVPIPPTPFENVIPPMPMSSTASSRSSTPSTLRTTRDFPLPSLDMPNVTATFPMPQQQMPVAMDNVVPPPPMFMAPTMQMPVPSMPAVIPGSTIPPTPFDTTFGMDFATRAVDFDAVPLPADFVHMPEPTSVVPPSPSTLRAMSPRSVSPRSATPQPVIPPAPALDTRVTTEPMPVAETMQVDVPAPVPAAVVDEHRACTVELSEVPSIPVVPEFSEDTAAHTASPEVHVHVTIPRDVAIPDRSRSVSPAPAVHVEPRDFTLPPQHPGAVVPTTVVSPSPSQGSPRFVPLPPSPSRSALGDGESIAQSMWDAAHDLRQAVQTTLNAAQGAEVYSRQAQEILGIVRQHGEECAKQLEECTRLREAAKSDKDDARAEREHAQSLRDESNAERERGIAERDARIGQLEEELAALNSQVEEHKLQQETLDAERELARAAADAERAERIKALEDELETIKAEREQEKEARLAEDAERQFTLEETRITLQALEEAKAESEARIATLEEEKSLALAEYEKAKEDHSVALVDARAEAEARIATLEEEKASAVAGLEKVKEEHEAVLSDKDSEKEHALDEARVEREQVVADLEGRVKEKEEELDALRSQHEEESQAGAEREAELKGSIVAAEERIQCFESELSVLRDELDREKADRATAEAEREATYQADIQARDAESAEKARLLAERIAALDEELGVARAAYMAEHERLVNEHETHATTWAEREFSFMQAEAELRSRVATLEDDLSASREQHEEARQSLASAITAHEEKTATLEEDLAVVRGRHTELENSFADSTAAHEERVGALEMDLDNARSQYEEAQRALAEFSEKEAAWTEREGGLVTSAEERDTRIKALEDELTALREEQEQERQRRVAEDGERAERELAATVASLERERTIAESHDSRIKELTDELAALRAEREQDRQQREVEDVERREADKAEAKQVAEAHTTQLSAIEESLTKMVEHSDEQFVQYETRVQDVVVRLDKLDESLEANKAELQSTVQSQLEALESSLRTDSAEKHEDILAKLKTLIEEQAAAAITNCIAEFSTMLESLGTTQQAEILSALRVAIQEQVTLNISFYIEELSKTWDVHGARLIVDVLDTVRATARDVVEFNTDNHLTDFCKNLAPEMLQLFHEIREKEEEKQKLDRQIDVLRRHKRDYESGDLREGEDISEEAPMKGAWRGRSQGRRKGGSEPASAPLPIPPEQPYHHPLPQPPSRRAPSYQEPDAGRPMSSWSSWQHDIITQSSSDPSIQLALIPPPVDGGEFNARAPYYRE